MRQQRQTRSEEEGRVLQSREGLASCPCMPLPQLAEGKGPDTRLSHLCIITSLRRDKAALSSSFLSKPGSSQQHSSPPNSPPVPTGCQCHQDEDAEASHQGSWEESLQATPPPSAAGAGPPAWSRPPAAGRLQEVASEVPLKGHTFPPLVQRPSIQSLLLEELREEGIHLLNKIQGLSQGGEDPWPAPRSHHARFRC